MSRWTTKNYLEIQVASIKKIACTRLYRRPSRCLNTVDLSLNAIIAAFLLVFCRLICYSGIQRVSVVYILADY